MAFYKSSNANKLAIMNKERQDGTERVSNTIASMVLPKKLENNNLLKKQVTRIIRFILFPSDFSNSFNKNNNLGTIDFYRNLFNKINFTYELTESSIQYIPRSGPVIFVANHALGPADIFLPILLSKYRTDIKVVVSNLLYRTDTGFSDIFLSAPLLPEFSIKYQLSIVNLLKGGGALLIFPASKIPNRLHKKTLKDEEWNSFFCRLARESGATIVPIRTNGCHSAWLYYFSYLGNWTLDVFQLFGIRLMFRMKNRHVRAAAGYPITSSELEHFSKNPDLQCTAVRKRLEEIIF